ncbi:MAG: AAA family ATPase [Clostridia bacterium]|nr:AAA family ATPase [Clostridia bacterium]
MAGKIVLISGPCGAGKTTISRLMVQNTDAPKAVHMHTDDFYTYIQKGYIPPWQDGSGDQNDTVIRAAAACAETYAEGDYDVYVDGVIGPWFIAAWQDLVRKGVDVRYVVLRPDRDETVRRGLEREARAEFPLTEQVFTDMWEMFRDLGAFSVYAMNTGSQTAAESAACLKARLQNGEFRLSAFGEESEDGM